MDFLEKELERSLKMLGCTEVTSKTHRKNGTTAWRLPRVESRHAWSGFRVVVSETKRGYVRNNNEASIGYQLNPRKYTERWYGTNGTRPYMACEMVMLKTRPERLAKILAYVIGRINRKE